MDFFDRVDGHVAGSRDDDVFAVEGVVAGVQHAVGEVGESVACGFGAGVGAAPEWVFAGEDAGFVVAVDAFVLAEEVTDFAGADADVAGGDVALFAEVVVEFGHEGLAETHDFGVAFAFGVEVAAAFSGSELEAGEGVFEDLFKAEEFDGAEGDGGVESQAAFGGAKCGGVLHSEAAVDVGGSGVVGPGNFEGECAFGFDDAFEGAVGEEFRLLLG